MSRPLSIAAALLLALVALAIGIGSASAAKPSEPAYAPSLEGFAFHRAMVGADGSILTTRQDDSSGAGFVTRARYLADGKLDPTFKPIEEDEAPEAVDAQGRTLRTSPTEGNGRALERINADGSVDTAFGDFTVGAEKWTVLVNFSIEAILPLASGKIVTAGVVRGGVEGEHPITAVKVARYDEAGRLDPTFGTGGEMSFPIVGKKQRSEAVVGLTPGAAEDVLVALDGGPERSEGSPAFGDSSTVFAVAGDGRLDPSFADHGVLRSPDSIAATAGVSGGGLLITGARWAKPGSRDSGAGDFYLTRLTSAGAPDPSFGERAGTTTLDLGPIDLARSLLLRPDGSILVGGVTTTPRLECLEQTEPFCEETPVVVGFTAAGTVDPGFASGGVLRLDSLRFDFGTAEGVGTLALAEAPGGNIVAGGGTGGGAFLAAVGPGGRLDPRFGGDGIITVVQRHRSFAHARGLAVDHSGRILAIAQTNAGGRSDDESGAVFSFRPDGAIDRRFAGGRGYVRMPGNQVAFTVDRRGRTSVLAGVFSVATVTRVTASGELDRRFGSEGIARLPEHSSVTVRGRKRLLEFYPRSIATVPGGGVVVAGTASGLVGTKRIEVMRLTDRGRLDRSFGHGGIVLLGLGVKGECNADAMAVLPDGRILLAGSVLGGRPHVHQIGAVVRLLPNGRLDRSFGKRGVTAFDVPGQSVLTTIAVGPGGEIVTAGPRIGHRQDGPLLALLSAGGRVDRAFLDRAVRSLRGPRKQASSPDRLVLAAGGPILFYDRFLAATVYSGNGSFQRRLVLGTRRHPATRIEGAAVQGKNLLVASQTAGHRTFTLRRVPLK